MIVVGKKFIPTMGLEIIIIMKKITLIFGKHDSCRKEIHSNNGFKNYYYGKITLIFGKHDSCRKEIYSNNGFKNYLSWKNGIEQYNFGKSDPKSNLNLIPIKYSLCPILKVR